MNIVIAGAGKVGSTLSSDLAKENHDILLIELSEAKLDQSINAYDIRGIVGNGATYEILMEASVDRADVFIAVMGSDETNMIAAITAKKLGAKYVIARVRNPEYSAQVDFLRESLGITLMINPELEAAKAVSQMLLFPNALSVESFAHGRVNLVEVRLSVEAPMVGMRLRDLRDKFGRVIVCVVSRGAEVIIPNGETRLMAGDLVMVTGTTEHVRTFCDLAQSGVKNLSSALIVGGGRVTDYLVNKLLQLRMRVKVIEINPEIADRLALKYPRAEIALGDGTRQGMLNEEHLTEYDALIALTGIDEENILTSIYAARRGVKKTITKVNRTDLLKILDKAGLQAIITPQRLIADQIVRFIRSRDNAQGSNVTAFYRLAEDRVEILQFAVHESSRAARTLLSELAIKPGALVVCIMRRDQLIFPGGVNQLMPGDDVIVATIHQGFQDLDDFLDER
jgi:trk system potassium uptake protein TrkA